jgi:hypothetical protein
LSNGAIADNFWYIESQLLQFQRFSRNASNIMLTGENSQGLSACDNHAQRALLLIEVPLADNALRSGAVRDYDSHINSLEMRAKQALACTPRDAFIWLLLFGFETMHGNLDEHAFNLLAMSYDTAPNEAWIAVRRIVLALPVLRATPESLQRKVLGEYQSLVQRGFFDTTARAYIDAPAATQALLQSRIDTLDPRAQKRFLDAVQKLRS